MTKPEFYAQGFRLLSEELRDREKQARVTFERFRDTVAEWGTKRGTLRVRLFHTLKGLVGPNTSLQDMMSDPELAASRYEPKVIADCVGPVEQQAGVLTLKAFLDGKLVKPEKLWLKLQSVDLADPTSKGTWAWAVAVEILVRACPKNTGLKPDPADRWSVINVHRAACELMAQLLAESPAMTPDAVPAPGVPSTNPSEPACKHDAEFTSVVWYGTSYYFTKGLQSKVVKYLWTQWEKGFVNCTTKTIQEAVNAEGGFFEVPKVFHAYKQKRHPAWSHMIHTTSKGCYGLGPPPDVTAGETGTECD